MKKLLLIIAMIMLCSTSFAQFTYNYSGAGIFARTNGDNTQDFSANNVYASGSATIGANNSEVTMGDASIDAGIATFTMIGSQCHLDFACKGVGLPMSRIRIVPSNYTIDTSSQIEFWSSTAGAFEKVLEISQYNNIVIGGGADDTLNKLQVTGNTKVTGAIRSYVASVSGDEKGLVDDSIFIYEYKAYKSISNAATFELPINYGKIELHAVSQGATCSIIYGPSGGTVTSQVSGGTYGLSSGASDINVFPVSGAGTALQIQNSSGSTLFIYIKCFGKKP